MNPFQRQIAIRCAIALGAKRYQMGDKQGIYQANDVDEDSMPFFLDEQGRNTTVFDPIRNKQDVYYLQTQLGVSVVYNNYNNVVVATLNNFSFSESFAQDKMKATTLAICGVVTKFVDSTL